MYSYSNLEAVGSSATMVGFGSGGSGGLVFCYYLPFFSRNFMRRCVRPSARPSVRMNIGPTSIMLIYDN